MCIKKTGCATFIVRLMQKINKSMLIGCLYVSLTISFLCRLHVSVNLFSVLDVFENHYFISATK